MGNALYYFVEHPCNCNYQLGNEKGILLLFKDESAARELARARDLPDGIIRGYDKAGLIARLGGARKVILDPQGGARLATIAEI